MQQSPQWRNGRFRNPQPLWNDLKGSLAAILRRNPHGRPAPGTLTPLHPDPADLAVPAPTGLRGVWMGHSTLFLEIDGVRVLTDPVWGERASPLPWAGPRRWYPAPLPLEALPRPHVVLLSHNHYDHLDRGTIRTMAAWDTRFVAPLGVGRHLRAWGIAPERITELDWWQSTQAGPLSLTATPARHASGRGLFDRDTTLWAGFALKGPRHSLHFSGDTGFFPGFREIGERLGPFDLTFLEIGAYGQAWPDWHLGPEQAVQAHLLLQGRAMVPIHWGLFDLSNHGWTEPIERLRVAAQAQGVRLGTPRPGEPFEPEGHFPGTPWWPNLPWRSAQEAPIRATPDGRRPGPLQ